MSPVTRVTRSFPPPTIKVRMGVPSLMHLSHYNPILYIYSLTSSPASLNGVGGLNALSPFSSPPLNQKESLIHFLLLLPSTPSQLFERDTLTRLLPSSVETLLK